MKYLKIKKRILFLLLMCCKIIFAQNIQVVISPSPSPYISDWQTKTETVKLIITNTTGKVVVAKIKTELFDGSNNIVAQTMASKMPEMEIPMGVSTYNAEDVLPSTAIEYKGKAAQTTIKTGRIPDDNYRLCVALTNPSSGQVIGTSGTVCKSFTIIAYTAPVLLSPANNTQIKMNNTTGIFFRWTPTGPKPPPFSKYVLQIWEVLDGQTPMVALRTNKPIIEKEVNNLNQVQWPVDFPKPSSEQQYVWTITPIDEKGNNLIDGAGISEPFTFTISPEVNIYFTHISPINNAKIRLNKNQGISFKWRPDGPKCCPPGGYRLKVWQILKNQSAEDAVKVNKPIFIEQTHETEISTNNLLIGACSSAEPCNYVWLIEALDGDKILKTTKPTVFYVTNNSNNCCGGNVINNVWLKRGDGSQTETFDFINCISKTTYINSGSNMCNQDLYVGSAINNYCTGTCVTTMVYTLTNNSTSANFSGINSLTIPANLGNGNYTLKMELKCGDSICRSCTSQIIKNCSPICSCVTNSMEDINWTNLGTIHRATTISTIIAAGSSQTISFPLSCTGCTGSVNYTIYNSSFAIVNPTVTVSAGTPATFTTPTSPGTYMLKAQGYCNGNLCDSFWCWFTIPNQTDCCKGGYWEQRPTIKDCNFKTLFISKCDGKDIYEIHNCKQKCGLELSISASYICGSNSTCSGKIKYKIEGSGGYSNSSTGSLTISASLPNGTYTITTYAYCGDKLCDSCFFKIKKDCPSAANCCPGKWIKFVDESTGNSISYLTNLGAFKCKESRKFTFCYDCPQGCGTAQIKYEILDAVGNLVGAAITTSNCATTTVIFPSVSGTYELRVSGMCNEKVCNWLRYPFTVKCDTIKDCCKGSYWKQKPSIYDETGSVIPEKPCDQTFTILINDGLKNCKKEYTIKNGFYNCAQGCVSKIVYKITNSSGGTVLTGINSLTFGTSLANGVYTLRIYAYCGNQICDSTCKFGIRKDCSPQNCCKGGMWFHPGGIYNSSNSKIFDINCSQPMGIFTISGALCNQNFTVKNAAYQCSTGTNCTSNILYQLVNNSTGNIVTQGLTSISISSALGNGNYTLNLIAICGKDTCAKCSITVKINCSDLNDCCKNADQKDPEIYDKSGNLLFKVNCNQSSTYLINSSSKNCDIDLYVKASANCNSTFPNCQSKIVYNLSNSGATYTLNGIGYLLIPATMPNGTYTVKIDYYCGNSICKKCSFTIKKDCPPPPKNCCEGSTWGKMYFVHNGIKNSLPPGHGELGKFDCKEKVDFMVCYNCAKECSAAQIRYDVYNTLGTILHSTVTSASCNTVTIVTPSISGNYKILITPICNGVECAQSDYNFNVYCPGADSSCCLNSSWGQISQVVGDGLAPFAKCGESLGTLNCKELKNLKFCFNCKPNCGPAKIKYQTISTAIGLPDKTYISSNCTPQIVEFPSAIGSYELVVTAICGEIECKVCKFPFKVKCPANCCDSSRWTRSPEIADAATGAVLKPINCDSKENYYINKNNKNCNVNFLVRGLFSCNPTMNQCQRTQIIELTDNLGNSIYASATGSLMIPSTLPNGIYTLCFQGFCNGVICKTCCIKIIKDCDSAQIDCCKGGKWEPKQFYISAPLIKTKPTEVVCNEKYTVECIEDGTITFNPNYICGTGCTKKVYIKILDSDGEEIINKPAPVSFGLINSGNYTVTYYAKCGDKICDSCKFYVNIKPCKSKDCCAGSDWANKSISWPDVLPHGGTTDDGDLPKGTAKLLPPSGIGHDQMPPSSLNIMCGKEYALSQYGTYTFNAGFLCATKNCPATVKVKITGNTNSTYDGTYAMPFTQTFNIPDNYTIEYIAYCGGQECGKCAFYLTITGNCCANSKWIKADYQIVNKKADGSWIFEPTIGSLPLPVSSVPTYKADLAVNVENLTYQCNAQRGCEVRYVVRRKNLQTGNLVAPDEWLPVGQNSTSIYTQLYPQQVWIWAECGGQRCGLPIRFKVECLHKDCVPPCDRMSNSLDLSTGMNSHNNALPVNTQDDLWSGHFTGSHAPNGTYTCKALFPQNNTGGNSNYTGTFTIHRGIYICVEGDYNLQGIVRCDKLQSLQIVDANSNPVWTASALPTGGSNFYTPFNVTLNIHLIAGLYQLKLVYSGPTATDAYGFPMGLSFCGGITTTNGGLANTAEDCCFKSTTVGVGNHSDVGAVKTCGTWEIIKYAHAEDVAGGLGYPRFPINDTIYAYKNELVWTYFKYTCYNPACSLTYNITSPIIPNYFQSNVPWFCDANYEGPVSLGVSCCGENCPEQIIYIKRINRPNSMLVTNGMLNGNKQLLSKEEIAAMFSEHLKPGSVIDIIQLIKNEKGKYELIVTAKNEQLHLVQSVSVDLIEQNDGLLSLSQLAKISTQSTLPSLQKSASPGGGTCKKCGATFTNEQDFITHQENCEYTSISTKINGKPHNYVGHVTLLK